MKKSRVLIAAVASLVLAVSAFFVAGAIVGPQLRASNPFSGDVAKIYDFLIQSNGTQTNAEKLGITDVTNYNGPGGWKANKGFVFDTNDKLTMVGNSNTSHIDSLRGKNLHGILDVSGCTELTEIYVNRVNSVGNTTNKLSGLNVTGCKALTHLYLGYNLLTALDVSENTALQRLSCHSNQLTALDVSENKQLVSLDCDSNQLADLDISENTLLQALYCSFNQISSLDVGNNTLLTHLSCDSNQITSLDLSNNTLLQWASLNVSLTPLKFINISGNVAADFIVCTYISFIGPQISITSGPLNASNNLSNPDILSFMLFPYVVDDKVYVSASVDIEGTTYDFAQEFTLNGTMPSRSYSYIYAQIDINNIDDYFDCWTVGGNPITEIGSGSSFNNATDVMWASFTDEEPDPIELPGVVLYASTPSVDFNNPNFDKPQTPGADITLDAPTDYDTETWEFLGWFDEDGVRIETIKVPDDGTEVTVWARWQAKQQTPPPPAPGLDLLSPKYIPWYIAFIVLILSFILFLVFTRKKGEKKQ